MKMDILKPFILEDFDIKKPFSSFLPGVAGKRGIPLWTYYSNRGQGITSVGSKDKNGAILEFNPACISYEMASTQGFRTFLKINGKIIEAFAPRKAKDNLKRTMYITGASFMIEEINADAGYKINVTYFGLPQMPIGALVRRVNVTALKDIVVEVIDGTTQVLPYGVNNGAYKDCGNLMRSWMDVYYIKEKTPFYTMRASSSDEAEVSEVKSGNFYIAKSDNKLLDVICDIEVIFNEDSSRQIPCAFYEMSVSELIKKEQYVVNKIPCAFVTANKILKTNESIEIDSMLGYLPQYELLQKSLSAILDENFFNEKEIQASTIIKDLTNDVETKTNYPLFDEYIRQSYLDNFLRGGYPVNLGTDKSPIPYYVYSRKHGDPERDYNWFNLEPEYYSQGNGNFRDVNQNRRSDVIFNPFIKDKNIKLFMNLIALDGYNPLVINGNTYTIKKGISIEEISLKLLGKVDNGFVKFLSNKFTPGGIINYCVKNELDIILSDEEVFMTVLLNSDEHTEALFGEGYWIDHFTYNLDLIETYLWLNPEKKDELLFKDSSYCYYVNPEYVRVRSEKIGLTKKGTIRQYGSMTHLTNEEKKKIGYVDYCSNWAKDKLGNIYKVNLASKLINLVICKFTSRDPFGYGLMMEANKPGWNDAMNGLPGLMSSGVSEVVELVRIIDFLVESFENKNEIIKLPKEVIDLYNATTNLLNRLQNKEISQIEYFEQTQVEVEKYREFAKLSIIEKEKVVSTIDLLDSLKLMSKTIWDKISELNTQYEILPTYLEIKVTDYDVIEGTTPYGLQKVKINKYEINKLPYFLEAPTRYLKTKGIDKNKARTIYNSIKKSEMYDKKLKMYRTCVDLDPETLEIGRVRAFTKGWLERESNFMHMTFKYLYGLLKSHLYEEFFEEIKTNFPAFMNPDVYGRSVFENSSFIATSCNPNPNVHGEGFVARLSGSNTEVVSMWLIMMFGYEPFKMVEDKLCLQLKPILPIDFFSEGKIYAKFLKSIDVVYENMTDKNTYDTGVEVVKYELIGDCTTKTINNSIILGQDAIDVRDKKYAQIKVYLGYNK